MTEDLVLVNNLCKGVSKKNFDWVLLACRERLLREKGEVVLVHRKIVFVLEDYAERCWKSGV